MFVLNLFIFLFFYEISEDFLEMFNSYDMSQFLKKRQLKNRSSQIKGNKNR